MSTYNNKAMKVNHNKSGLELVAIVLTKTSSDFIHKITNDCINSLLESANSKHFALSIVVIESDNSSQFSYPNATKTIVPGEPFNFHRFLNIGIQSEPEAEWYLLCNNDLLFTKDWLKKIELVISLRPDVGSLSPISPTCQGQKEYVNSSKYHDIEYVLGYERRKQLSGWCIMVKRETLNIIGKLDERFDFYFADDDYSLSLRRSNVLHALVLRSEVYHLEDNKISKSIALGSVLKAKEESFPSVHLKKKYAWIMSSEKMIDGFRVYTNKWGDIRILSMKIKLHDLLFLRLGIGFFSNLLFRPKR